MSVYSRSVEEHWGHLRRVLERLRAAMIYGRLHKCEFLRSRFDYLGFDISADGVHALSEKAKSVVELPTSQTVHEVI